MMAASAVLFSHSYPAAIGPTAAEPLTSFLPFTLGTAAVKVFFAVSGFLIMMSFERRGSFLEFVVARVLRIYPALLVVTSLTAFVIGPLFTSWPLAAYLRSPETLAYVPRALSLAFLGHELPGVFAGNPHPGVNGPLWTLYFEVSCYCGLAVAGLAGFLTPRRFPILLAAYVPAYLGLRYHLIPLHLDLYVMLSLPFIVGMAIYRYRDRIILSGVGLAGLVALAALCLWRQVLVDEICTLAIAYGSLWIGSIQSKSLLSYNRLGDYSYGVYIYGWPMQQIIVALDPGISPIPLMLLAFPAALACGVASWMLIERPALRSKKRVTALLARRVRPGTGGAATGQLAAAPGAARDGEPQRCLDSVAPAQRET